MIVMLRDVDLFVGGGRFPTTDFGMNARASSVITTDNKRAGQSDILKQCKICMPMILMD